MDMSASYAETVRTTRLLIYALLLLGSVSLVVGCATDDPDRMLSTPTTESTLDTRLEAPDPTATITVAAATDTPSLAPTETLRPEPTAPAATDTPAPAETPEPIVQAPQINIPRPNLPGANRDDATLAPEWYVDSDGNVIPDFLEIELGYDPLVDDCAPAACQVDPAQFDASAAREQNTLIILDASGSMSEMMGSETRMAAAKDVLLQYVALQSSTTNLGFLVYGHKGDRTEAGKPASCDGVELLADLGEVSAETFPTLLDQFEPTGWTPIAGALQAAEARFADKMGAVNKIILITDGLETCEGDPVATARSLSSDPNIQLVVDVVGFGISNQGDEAALREIADAGNGDYFQVESREAFIEFIDTVIDQGLARLNFAVCFGQSKLDVSVCSSNMQTSVSTAIATTLLNPNNQPFRAELNALSDRIEAAELERQARIEAWIAENDKLIEELETIRELRDQLRQ